MRPSKELTEVRRRECFDEKFYSIMYLAIIEQHILHHIPQVMFEVRHIIINVF